jgi:nicotinate-nucleotide pyrophosphorylase (carboxylating)
VEVEVTNLAELDEAIAAGADVILVDNADPDGLRAAVARARQQATAGRRVRLEASGGVTLANLADVARTGVDYVSLGALTHSAGSVDFSLLFQDGGSQVAG